MLIDDTDESLRIWAQGWDAAVAWLWPQLQRLEAECDRLYVKAFNPDERAQIISQRLDQHFRDEWERFSSTEEIEKQEVA